MRQGKSLTTKLFYVRQLLQLLGLKSPANIGYGKWEVKMASKYGFYEDKRDEIFAYPSRQEVIQRRHMEDARIESLIRIHLGNLYLLLLRLNVASPNPTYNAEGSKMMALIRQKLDDAR